MTQATRVYSTPPTNTSAIDPTRRRFLTVAAAASMTGLSPAIAAITTTAQAAGEGINLSANTINVLAPKTPSKEITPSQGIEGDPIYGAIEKHQAAAIVWDAAVDVEAKFPAGPEWGIERERIHEAWCDARNALDDVAIDLINTAPTTLAGIARALNYISDDLAFLAAHPTRRSNSEAIAHRRAFKEAMRQRIREIAASRGLSDEEIKPVLSLKHQRVAEFVDKHGVNFEWLYEGRGRTFEKDPIRLNPNMTGNEFAAVVTMLPEADQQAIRATVSEILQERDQ
jgi:hypothetical protein